MKHIPLRTCIVCRQQKEKSELLRIVGSADGELSFDPSGKAPGRGAYICRCGNCMDNLVKKRGLDRAYKTRFSPEVYTRLREQYDIMTKE